MKKFGVMLAVFASLVFAGSASAGGYHRHHHHRPPTPTPPVVVVTPQVDRDGACVNGVFTNLEESQIGFANGWYYPGATYNGASVVPAYWVQGLGETCDNPVALGYTATGFNVSGDGTVDTAGPQFNIHPYYVKIEV